MAVTPLTYNDVINSPLPPSSIAADAVARLRSHLRHPTKEVRWLATFGWVLVLSGLVHVVVWLLDGSPPLAGPTGWRKPIVFGFSGGVATLSLAALAAGAPAMPRWSRVYAVTMGLEIALIDVQAWRGVGSHFNIATPLDGAIFSLMGLLIVVSMVAATVVGVSATRAQREVDLRLSSGLATAALVIGSALGIAISVHGSIAQVAGLPPARLGAGEWKPVHAIALHGMQLFPVVAWWLRRRWPTASDRSRALLGVGVAWALVLTASFVQLLLRRAPSDPALVPVVLAVAGLVVGLVSVTPAVRTRVEVA